MSLPVLCHITQIPAGIFLPTIAIGACLGRAVGLLTFVTTSASLLILINIILSQGLYRAYPTAWPFLSCPPDPSVRCISPGFYAVIGAAAMLGGVTRMTSKPPSPSISKLITKLKFPKYLWWLSYSK